MSYENHKKYILRYFKSEKGREALRRAQKRYRQRLAQKRFIERMKEVEKEASVPLNEKERLVEA